MDLKSATASAAATMVLSAGSALGFMTGTAIPYRGVQPVAGLYDTWVELPTSVARAAPRAQQLVVAIRRMTGWSHRRLAAIVGSTHPTVAAVEQGRSEARTGELFARLVEVSAVVERVHLLADRSPVEADRLLSATPPGGIAAVDQLMRRDPGAAYLAVLDLLHPPSETGMMTGFWPSRVGEATTGLHVDTE